MVSCGVREGDARFLELGRRYARRGRARGLRRRTSSAGRRPSSAARPAKINAMPASVVATEPLAQDERAEQQRAHRHEQRHRGGVGRAGRRDDPEVEHETDRRAQQREARHRPPCYRRKRVQRPWVLEGEHERERKHGRSPQLAGGRHQRIDPHLRKTARVDGGETERDGRRDAGQLRHADQIHGVQRARSHQQHDARRVPARRRRSCPASASHRG